MADQVYPTVVYVCGPCGRRPEVYEQLQGCARESGMQGVGVERTEGCIGACYGDRVNIVTSSGVERYGAREAVLRDGSTLHVLPDPVTDILTAHLKATEQ